jgi:hypothetical protein
MPTDRPRRFAVLAAWVVGAALASGCSAVLESSPEPTAADFPGIASDLANRGLTLTNFQSGDDGCQDRTLTGTAVGFDAKGLGVTDPIHLRVYIFRNPETYDRRRPDVDTCVAAWATDPATVEMIDASPFVLAGQGPWPEAFKAAVRDSLSYSAGSRG